MKVQRALKLFMATVMAAGATLVLAGCNPSESTVNAAEKEEGAPAGWVQNYEEALRQAAQENKMVLLDFTGSDWCPPCMHLEKTVFQKEEFKDYARQKLVAVQLDFPRGKELPKWLQEQNERLAEKYSIEGFPTLILLRSDGTEAKRKVGSFNSPQEFINWAQS